MYGVSWLKTDVNIFSNRKIEIILSKQDGDTYFRVWIQLLTIAMKCNNEGRLIITENKPMTIKKFFRDYGKIY